MTPFPATIQDGRVIAPHPIDLPNGTEVEISVREPAEEDELDIHGDSPESIARWFALWDSIPVPTTTEDELKEMDRLRQEYREWELAHAEERLKKLVEGCNEALSPRQQYPQPPDPSQTACQ